MIRIDKTLTGTQSVNFDLSINSKRIYDKDTTSYIYMRISNDMTRKNIFVYPTAVVTARYTTLTLSLLDETTTTTPTITAGEIRFTHEGYHTYTVYNVPNNSFTDEPSSQYIIEQGKLYYATVQQEEAGYTKYTPPTDDNENILNNNNTVYLNF
jgi:hypothetical protein